VSETTRHGAEEGFHEIQLTGKQLVFLFMATTVVAVVIFLCGVLVGREAQSGRMAEAEQQAPAPAAPADDLPPMPPQTGEPSPATGESLSYAQRLQGDEPKEQLKMTPEGSESAPDPPAPVDAPPEYQGEQAQPAPPPASDAGVASERPAPPAASGWVVQVAALRDRTAAIKIVQRLSSRGFPAFILEPAPGVPAPGYRVRVGPYQDRQEAERIGRRLEREEQFKPFITR
jgi:cell division septation protein DedD